MRVRTALIRIWLTSLSSATRMRSAGRAASDCCASAAAGTGSLRSTKRLGIEIVKRLPSPGVLVVSISPPIICTISRVIARPNPLPP